MPGDIIDSSPKQSSEINNVGEIRQLFNGDIKGAVLVKGQCSVQ